MSAEQRKQFEIFLDSWFDEYDRALLNSKEITRLRAAFEAGHLSRDAEVQALRERNGRLAHELFVLGIDIDASNDEEGGAE